MKVFDNIKEIETEDAWISKTKVKRGLAGLGLFADEDIAEGDKIIEYIGKILLGDEAVNANINMYLFEVSKNKTIDGSVRWNKARYMNHSCNGNSESEIRKGRVFVCARKNIKKGEEITYDYGEEFFKEYIGKNCMCSSKKHMYQK